MSLNIGVVMDPIAQIKPWKDTTLAMLLEAQRRGWNLHYMEPADLYVRDGRVFAVTSDLTVRDDNQDWFTLGDPAPRDLTGMDMILMRQDPPFDAAYLYATYLLEKVEREGVLVANRPASVRDSNEKLFATDFPQCCVPTLVSGRAALLREFVKEQGDTVMKPLDAMGGTNVFRIEPGSSNLSVIIDVLTEDGKTPIMAQRFVPEIKQGDKRILMINGEPVPYALARIPKEGEFRGNLAAGGTGEGRELTDRRPTQQADRHGREVDDEHAEQAPGQRGPDRALVTGGKHAGEQVRLRRDREEPNELAHPHRPGPGLRSDGEASRGRRGERARGSRRGISLAEPDGREWNEQQDAEDE